MAFQCNQCFLSFTYSVYQYKLVVKCLWWDILSENNIAKCSLFHVSEYIYPIYFNTCRIFCANVKQTNWIADGYSSIHLILLWNGIIPIHNVHIFDPEYSLYNIEQSSERQKSVVGGGEFSYINVEITLRRSFPAQLIAQALFPTLFFAALAYFTTFFMDRNEKGKKNSIKSQPAGDTNTEEEEDDTEENPNPQQVQVEIENSTLTTILYKISFDILKVGSNMFFLLIVVLVKQINFLKSPRSSQLNALDVWMGVMSLIIFICFVLSLQICCRKWIRIYRNRIMVR